MEWVLKTDREARSCAQSVFTRKYWASLNPALASIVLRLIRLFFDYVRCFDALFATFRSRLSFLTCQKTELRSIFEEDHSSTMRPRKTKVWPVLDHPSTLCNLKRPSHVLKSQLNLTGRFLGEMTILAASNFRNQVLFFIHVHIKVRCMYVCIYYMYMCVYGIYNIYVLHQKVLNSTCQIFQISG
jgi:hypothetical protein